MASGPFSRRRLFWLCCCLLSWYGSALLMAASWKAFQSNAISFATETNYKDWDTEFPSVHVCDMDNDQRIDLVRSQIESEDNRRYDLDEVYKEITYFSGEATFIKNTCYDMDGNFDNSSDCPIGNFTEIAAQYRTPCNLAFGECEFNGKKFNCCDHFLTLPTEIGVCYSFNSIQTHPVKAPLKTTSNSKVKAARISVEVFINGMVFVLARQDVPTVNVIERAKFRITTGAHIRRFFSVKEVENDMQVRDTSTAQRRCRFPNEALDVLPAYSYSACVTQCRRDEQLRLCGCASHQTPNIRAEQVCDLEGLVCLDKYRMRLSVLRHRDSTLDRLYCPCTLGCEHQELKDTQGSMLTATNTSGSIFEVIVQSLPTVRFKRNVIRGKLDLVVSLGGTCGLLVGASLLSFVELLYYFTLRVLGDSPAAEDGGTADDVITVDCVCGRQLEVQSCDHISPYTH